MKLSKEPAYGRILVCGPSIHKAIPNGDPFDHPSCMGTLHDHYVFAAFNGSPLPEAGDSLIAEMSLPEADTVCGIFLGKTFIFLTPKSGSEPKQSIMLTLEDWNAIHSSDLGSASEPGCKYVRALLINVEDKPFFITATVRMDFASKWKPTLFNVGAWLEEVWMRTGKKISDEELKLRGHEDDGPAIRHTATNFGLEDNQKVRLLICHYFKHWESPAISYEGRGKLLAPLFSVETPMNKEAMHREHVEATCINPPPTTAQRKFVSLRKEARMLFTGSTHRIEPTEYAWLLAVLFPEEFSKHIERGLPVAELTRSHVKEEVIREDVLRLAKGNF